MYQLWFDGAVTKEKYRTASFGFVLLRDGQEIDRGWGLLGRSLKVSVVDAELQGLSYGLDSFIRHWDQPKSVLKIFGDSKIALGKASQDPVIGFKIREIERMGVSLSLSRISRIQNKIADDLAKKLRP
jgi:ribonuclease HI